MIRATTLLFVLLATTVARAETIQSGSLRVDVGTAPLSFVFTSDGGPTLASVTSGDPTGPSALSLRTAAGWIHATTVSSLVRKGNSLRMTVQTDDPQGGTFDVRVDPAGEGIIDIEASHAGAADEVLGIGAAWVA